MSLGKAAHVAKKVLVDPGFGFAVSGIFFMLALANPVGLIGCIIALTAITSMKALQAVDPPFMNRDNLFTRIVKDDRTTLCIMGLSMLTVMGATLSQGAIDVWAASSSLDDFVSKGWYSVILPSVASAAYAVTNFGFAADISTNQRRQRGEEVPRLTHLSLPGKIKLACRRPETYFAIGTVTSGLLAGGWSLLSLPLVTSGYLIAMKNIIRDRPSYTGHANMHFSAMSAALTTVCFAVGSPMLAMSYLLDTVYLGRVEALSTPGGFKRVVQDMREGCSSLVDKIAGQNKQLLTARQTFSQSGFSADASPMPEGVARGFAEAQARKSFELVKGAVSAPVPRRPGT